MLVSSANSIGLANLLILKERSFIYIYIEGVPKPMSQTSLGYSLPLIKQKSSHQHGSKSEQVPRYPLLCRNPRNAVISKKYATMNNA